MNAEDNSDIESVSDEDNHKLAMLSPIGKANAGTGLDSSLLDKGNKQKSVQHTQPPNNKSSKSAARNWKKGIDLQSSGNLEATAVPKK